MNKLFYIPFWLLPLMVFCTPQKSFVTEQKTENQQEPVAELEMTWKNVPIGGGGYVTGVVTHPSEPGLIYIRTDIGGAYRWNEEEKQWIPILDWVGVENSNLQGVDGMALDPNDPDVIYLALGKRISSEMGGIYKSSNRGQTWERLYSVKSDANNQTNRWAGESIAVDPNNSSVIYAGTRADGLLRTFDGGQNWEVVSEVPKGLTEGPRPLGVRSVLFDGSLSIGDKSAVIYAGIPGTGIYYSVDGGDTFLPLAGAPEFPNRMEIAGTGSLVVAHNSGVALYKDAKWSDITPGEEAGRAFSGVTVDAADVNKIVVSRFEEAFNNPIYRTEDGGRSWTRIGGDKAPRELHPDVPWWPLRYFSSATSAIALDPHQPGRLFLTDWFGTWHTPDVWADTTHWYTSQKGHEETVPLMLASPPEGVPLFTLVADVSGFRHESLEEYPLKRITRGNEGIDIAFCYTQPDYMALIDATSWSSDNTRFITSSDGGVTWNERAIPEGATSGKVAYSATDPDRMIYLPAESIPYYTDDGGATWIAGRGAPDNAVGDKYIWNSDHAIAADGVKGNRFYLYKSGKIFVTENGGADWMLRNGSGLLPPKKGWYLWVSAAPGMDGVVWVSLGANGLWKSEDAGKSFNKIEFFENSRLLGWGKAAPGINNPTAYVYGTMHGQWGLYRSTDMGASWIKITPDNFQFGGHPSVLTGDGQVFGRVYVGTGGRGVFYGEPAH